MRIKTTTYRDVQQKPCQFYWHGLLHITIGAALAGKNPTQSSYGTEYSDSQRAVFKLNYNRRVSRSAEAD
jgi:hypothetical protein